MESIFGNRSEQKRLALKPAKLSIITVNRNNATGLEQTIKSVIDQTYNSFEYIIIDGASTDASVEIIKKYNAKITFWISEPDTGIYNAMNKGIQKASGEYCYFLNSGDYLVNYKVIESVFSTFPSEDILFGNLYVMFNGQLVGEAFGKKIISFSDVYSNIIKHQASFIKRCLFDKYGLYNEKLKVVADWEFFIKTVGLRGVSYKYIDSFISYFDNDGVSNNNEDLVKKEKQEVVAENIPNMMYPDFEYLLKYKRYEGIFKYKYSFLLVRIFNRWIKF